MASCLFGAKLLPKHAKARITNCLLDSSETGIKLQKNSFSLMEIHLKKGVNQMVAIPFTPQCIRLNVTNLTLHCFALGEMGMGVGWISNIHIQMY